MLWLKAVPHLPAPPSYCLEDSCPGRFGGHSVDVIKARNTPSLGSGTEIPGPLVNHSFRLPTVINIC